MLLKTIKIDETSHVWSKDPEANYLCLRMVERQTNDLIRLRGYVYLNQICENLGVKWNPDDKNPCVKNDGADRIQYIELEIFEQSNNSFLINIIGRD